MPGKSNELLRVVRKGLKNEVERGRSVLLLGPRQTGKTTLIEDILHDIPNVTEIALQHPGIRQELEADPGLLVRRIEALEGKRVVFIDEAQKIPELFDAAQFLIDKGKAAFILTGSSARKLRRQGANLLPGRVSPFRMDPLLWSELGLVRGSTIAEIAIPNINDHVGYDFRQLCAYGSLPGIVSAEETSRASHLRAYAEIYLEEEIRAEALTRKVGAFSRFLELAAAESGTSPSLTKLSNESGVSAPLVKEYFRILEDTLVAERVDPFLRNVRKRVLASSRYYFFDIGVRNALARLPLTPGLADAQKGTLVEHAVVLEIRRRIRALGKPYEIYYWRTKGGAEVDCALDLGDEVIPIEIKSARHVALSELKGLRSFLDDYPKLAHRGFVVTTGKEPEKLSEQITAVPWDML